MARGISEIAMSSVRPGGTRQPVVRVSPVALPASAQVRLRRLAPACDATARTWPSCSSPSPTGSRAADVVRGVIEELIPLGDSGTDGDTL